MNYREAASQLKEERRALEEAYRPLGLTLGRWLVEESRRKAEKYEDWVVPKGVYHITEPICVGPWTRSRIPRGRVLVNGDESR